MEPIGSLLPQLEDFLAQARVALPQGELADRAAALLQALHQATKPPSRPGLYWWGGRWRRHDWGRIAHRLGREPDSSLAAEVGCDPTLVRRMRVRLGIPRWDPLGAMRPLLGKLPDREVARRLGLSRETVSARRRKLGIGPYRHRGRQRQEHEARDLARIMEGLDRLRRLSESR